ncbi:unnamed protein product [Anisakis simplex]|uniref:Pept_C1 domain-containing protein n=1 Tax=Anisakis simplex TaxID=6269 RepID=A0A0M3KDT1_ANISI|nr:unnamed protein product [Anisakis simplex]
MRDSSASAAILHSSGAGPDAGAVNDDSDGEPKVTANRRQVTTIRLGKCTLNDLKQCFIVVIGSVGLLFILVITTVILLRNFFNRSTQTSTLNAAQIYFNELLEQVRSEQHWTAVANENAFQRRQLIENNVEIRRVENYSATAYQGEYERIYSSTFHPRHSYELISALLNKFHIPPSVAQHFDARQHWPLCRSSIAKVYDQGDCWNYWLFATLSAIEDRICIASNGEEKMKLSAFHLLTCCQECGSCRGGNPEAVYIYWVKYGITTGIFYILS